MNAMQWILGRGTGTSSRTIWAVMMQAVPPDGGLWYQDVPHDPGDFGRCYRLLQLFPEWRERLPEVAAQFPKWGPMVAHWDELTEMYEANISSTGNVWSDELYQVMRGLEACRWLDTGWTWRVAQTSSDYGIGAPQMITDTSLIAHLEAVERLFGIDVSELSVVSTQDLQASDTIYRELASDEGERMYVVRRPAREER